MKRTPPSSDPFFAADRIPGLEYDDEDTFHNDDESKPQFEYPVSVDQATEAISECVTAGLGAAEIRGVFSRSHQAVLLQKLERQIIRELMRVSDRLSQIQEQREVRTIA
jgi:hypothetical protein